ncbi:hypothetical protein JKG47_02000 [Acidithiobacillus sp. MC6.1]|nr:hypothetical protein [Acidithiobacillus sp. MC6.1]
MRGAKGQIAVAPGLDIRHVVAIPADPHRAFAGEALAGKGRQPRFQTRWRWEECRESWWLADYPKEEGGGVAGTSSIPFGPHIDQAIITPPHQENV